MKKFGLLFLLFFTCFLLKAQEATRGTIKVEKKGVLTKIQYDNVNYRLVGIDHYGNVLDTVVREFEMSTTIKGIAYTEKSIGSFLTYEMQKIIGRCDGSCKLLFDNIIIKDKNGNSVKMKPYTYIVGYKSEVGEQ